MDQDTGLATVADELYGLDPSEFMAARTAAASAAKTAGDKITATAIGKLRRPTRSAWAVNLLTRHAHAALTELLELGDALAAAQESLSGPELRRLSTQRNQVVGAVARQAAGLAADRGQPLTDATRTEVATTLQAALADPEVRDLVIAGRVDKAHTYSGFGLGLATGSVPVLAVVPAAPATAPRRRAKNVEPDPETEQAELLAAVEAAQAAVTAAEQTAAAAQAELEQAATAVAETGERVDTASQDVADLRIELRRAEETETSARRAATEAGDAHHDALTAQQQAATALTEARRALRDLVS